MLSQTIPSYVYYEYSDDVDIQAFCAAYNQMTQQYVSWFYNASLPIYTKQSGPLLDWVCNGIYGFYRPTINNAPASDDVFQRCLTWQFYKGDGQVFNIRWLKRRCMRFLNGPNGTDPGVNQTYQISVTFGEPNIVYINILGGIAQITGGAIFNEQGFEQNAKQFDELDLNIQHYSDTTLAEILKECIDSGILSLPFQFTYVVNVAP